MSGGTRTSVGTVNSLTLVDGSVGQAGNYSLGTGQAPQYNRRGYFGDRFTAKGCNGHIHIPSVFNHCCGRTAFLVDLIQIRFRNFFERLIVDFLVCQRFFTLQLTWVVSV